MATESITTNTTLSASVSREALLDAIKRAVPIAEQRSVLPILSHLLIRAEHTGMSVIATDLETGIRVFVPCLVGNLGEACVPAKAFQKLVSASPKKSTILLEITEDGRLSVRANGSGFTIATMDPADYPAWSDLDHVPLFDVPAESFRAAVDAVVWAASTDDSRYNFNTVLFELNMLTATDGHRLAHHENGVRYFEDGKRLVPRHSLELLRKALNGEKELSLGWYEKNMVVRTEQFTFTARLVDGGYLDYPKVIPKDFSTELYVNRREFLAALDRLLPLTTAKNRGITVEFGADGDLELSARHPDLGEAKAPLGSLWYAASEPFTKRFNACYLKDALQAFDSEQVRWLHNADGVAVFRSDPDGDHFNLVMPMRQ